MAETIEMMPFGLWTQVGTRKHVLDVSPELRHTSGWGRSGSLGHPCKCQRVSRFGSVTARHLVRASAKLCGVEQRAPPMFGRATITLGIGPHSSLNIISKYLLQRCQRRKSRCPTWWSPFRIQVAPSVQGRKVWLTPTAGVGLPCSNAAKTRNPLKLATIYRTDLSH